MLQSKGYETGTALNGRMYSDGMLRNIICSMDGVDFRGMEHDSIFEWFAGQMASRGVLEMWIRHLRAVGLTAGAMAKKYSCLLGLDDTGATSAKIAGYYHDAGNILGFLGANGEGSYVSTRPVRELSADEMVKVKMHPLVSKEFMGRIDPDGSLGIGTAAVLNNVLSHHRDSDGGGYPSGPGIDDSAVPVGAHIVKAADVSDAATNPIHPRINGRQKIRDPKGLISEFEKNAGKLYHPEVAEIFCREIRDPNGVLSSSNWATR